LSAERQHRTRAYACCVRAYVHAESVCLGTHRDTQLHPPSHTHTHTHTDLAISWNDIATLEPDDVPRHQLLDRNTTPLPVSQAMAGGRRERLCSKGKRERNVVTKGHAANWPFLAKKTLARIRTFFLNVERGSTLQSEEVVGEGWTQDHVPELSSLGQQGR